jgi:hypothetical protein
VNARIDIGSFGKSAPSPTTAVHYDFMTAGVLGSTSGIDLVLSINPFRTLLARACAEA